MQSWSLILSAFLTLPDPVDLDRQPANTWVKRSPLPGGPPSPRMGYESTWGYDPRARLLVRWGGHNQGGGGEQNAETWIFDPVSARWTLKAVNDTAPGICCGQQNVFDVARGRFVRFPAFSGSHGWQWSREIALKNSSAWTYDLATNTWRDMRPMPEPRVSPLRCAAYDTDHEVIVVFGGEGNSEGTLAYDLYTNTWTRLRPPHEPRFRSGGNMAYDAARKLHILFGTQFDDDPHTWAYDLRANRWTEATLRTRQPPTDRNDPVLTYDPHNKVVLAVVRVMEGKGENARSHLETWALDMARRTWTRMNPPREPDVSGSRARMLTFLPDQGLAILENRTHPPTGPAEQQVWTYRFAVPAPERDPPAPPTDLRVVTTKDRALLNWRASPSAHASRHVILRGEGELPWKAPLRRLATVEATQTRYEDRTVKPGVLYHYAVVAEDRRGRAGSPSARARTQPPLVENVVASVLSEKEVALHWQPPATRDIVGYHVERATVEVWSEDQLRSAKMRTPPLAAPAVASLRRIGPFHTRATAITQTAWTDRVDLSAPHAIPGKPIWERRVSKEEIDAKGKPYGRAVFAYRVRAVNALGVTGGPSPWVLTLPSAPQHVYARENGMRCDLKWMANPEKGIKGYRIYRLDGRFNKQPVSRLTDEPIASTTWTDPAAGKVARRYHIVAVDTLGQEGIPSAPVWFEREWKAFYKPFVSEWHQ